jgi:hypothetical protein
MAFEQLPTTRYFSIDVEVRQQLGPVAEVAAAAQNS